MSEPTAEKVDIQPEPKVVVFGMDESRKPHAAWFAEADAELAERAAGFMRMKVLKVSLDDQRTLALQLPQGKVFASGKAFTPFIKMNSFLCLWDDLRLGKGGNSSIAMTIAAVVLAPAYLFMGANKLRQWPSYAWVWTLFFVTKIMFLTLLRYD